MAVELSVSQIVELVARSFTEFFNWTMTEAEKGSTVQLHAMWVSQP